MITQESYMAVHQGIIYTKENKSKLAQQAKLNGVCPCFLLMGCDLEPGQYSQA